MSAVNNSFGYSNFLNQGKIQLDEFSLELRIILPGFSHPLTKEEINRKISKCRAVIQQFSPTKINRHVDGGKRFRARQIALKSQVHQLESAQQKLSILLNARENIEKFTLRSLLKTKEKMERFRDDIEREKERILKEQEEKEREERAKQIKLENLQRYKQLKVSIS